MFKKLTTVFNASILRSLNYEDSTRALGVFRILLALILWSMWAHFLRLMMDLRPISIFMSLSFFIASFFMLIGFRSRLSTFITSLILFSFYYFLGKETHHHYYLAMICTFFLSLGPCGSSLSLDRLLEVRRCRKSGAPIPAESGPLWTTRLICFQLSMVYFWGAFHKLTPEFYSGARIEHFIIGNYGYSDWINLPYFDFFLKLTSWAIILFELLMSFCLWIPKLSIFFMILGFVFHFFCYYTLDPIRCFSVLSVSIYLLFLNPKIIDQILDDLI